MDVPGSALCVRFSGALHLEQTPILLAPLQTSCICGADVTLPFNEGEVGPGRDAAAALPLWHKHNQEADKKPSMVSLAV